MTVDINMKDEGVPDTGDPTLMQPLSDLDPREPVVSSTYSKNNNLNYQL